MNKFLKRRLSLSMPQSNSNPIFSLAGTIWEIFIYSQSLCAAHTPDLAGSELDIFPVEK
jgi:hypothetical protein